MPRKSLLTLTASTWRAQPTTEPEVERTGSIEGVVIDPEGHPVPGVEIAAERHAYGRETSDEAGGFALERLDAGVYSLVARGRGWRGASMDAVILNPGSHVTGLIVRVRRAASLSGQVVAAESGIPLPKKEVYLNGNDEFQGVVTDEVGRFRFDGLLEGDVTLQASRRDEERLTVMVRGDTEGVLLRASVFPRARAWLKGTNGQPIVGQQVGFFDCNPGVGSRNREVMTSTAGLAEYGPLRIGNRLEVSCHGCDRVEVQVTAARPYVDVHLVQRESRTSTTARIEAVALNAEGDALGATRFELSGPVEPREFHGYSGVEVAQGSYRVTWVGLDGYPIYERPSQIVEARSSSTARVVFRSVHLFSLVGTVEDATGGPIESAGVTLMTAGMSTSRHGRFTETDSEGAFRFESLARGTYELIAARADVGQVIAVAHVPGAPQLLTIPGLGGLEGRITASDGFTPAEVHVQLVTKRRQLARTLMTENGRYRLSAVDPGEYEVDVVAGQERVEAQVIIRPGATTHCDLTLRARARSRVRGTVIDVASGTPIPGVVVSDAESTRTDMAGAFVLTGVDRGFRCFDGYLPGWVSAAACSDVNTDPCVLPPIRMARRAPNPGCVGLTVLPDRRESAQPIDSVDLYSPAWRAGLRNTDRIVSISGRSVAGLDAHEFDLLMNVAAGETLAFALADGRTVWVEALPCPY
ncbi:MAG: carboxypeptidase regulatory-like domain-containing protein [Deltaproteobacteria bacterium]|nr:carboxypeptidase regulatory-like domain-containing protein [Deltaproteobacteria bacterium]